MINDLEFNHVLQVLDKRQLDLILRNNAKHLLPARREPQCFTSFYSRSKTSWHTWGEVRPLKAGWFCIADAAQWDWLAEQSTSQGLRFDSQWSSQGLYINNRTYKMMNYPDNLCLNEPKFPNIWWGCRLLEICTRFIDHEWDHLPLDQWYIDLWFFIRSNFPSIKMHDTKY